MPPTFSYTLYSDRQVRAYLVLSSPETHVLHRLRKFLIVATEFKS